MTIEDLPLLNACLNAVSALWLTAGYLFIRQRRIGPHRACMIAAFVTSILFLTSYLVYHAFAGLKHFVGPPAIRLTYLSILFTHTILAAAVPVLGVVTLRFGLLRQDSRHRAIARWTLPIWWYVSVTGVIIYLMLYHLSA